MKIEPTIDFVSWIIYQVFGVVMGFAVGFKYGPTEGYVTAGTIILLADVRYELTKIVYLTNNHDM